MPKLSYFTLAICLLVTLAAGQKKATTSSPTVDPVLARLAGTWTFESKTLGLGFITSTHPGEQTPPILVRRQGGSVTVSARLVTGQGSFGQPESDDFTFTLTRFAGNPGSYLLSVDSPSWLTLQQLPMTLSTTGDGLQGETMLPFREASRPVTVLIQFTPDGGHKWEFQQNQSNGMPLRSFTMTFTRPASAKP